MESKTADARDVTAAGPGRLERGAPRRRSPETVAPVALAQAAVALGVWAGGLAAQGPERVPIIGGPCEGCEAVFEGMPASPPPVARIAPEGEPGEPMVIEGVVYGPGGDPAPGVVVYAYHTDARGEYPRVPEQRGSAAYRHGRLRGWARTDADGRYRFETIRPASYPDGRTPAHVHMHVIEPGCCTYYIDSIHFLDDPRLPEAERSGDGSDARGGSGRVRPDRADGVWIVRRDIHLGRGVPGYPPR